MSQIPITTDQDNVTIDLGQIQFGRSITPGAVPQAINLKEGAIEINLRDRIIFTKDDQGNVVTLGRDYTADIATAKTEAITASNTYTDGQITALVAGADTSNDTLAKLAGRIDVVADAAQSSIDNLTAADVDLENVANYGITDAVNVPAASGGSELYASAAAAYTAHQRGVDAETTAIAYADQVKSDLLGGAPTEALDTIFELADAITNNQDAVTAINNAIATKADKTYVDTELAKKLDATLLSDVIDSADGGYAPTNVASSKAIIDLRALLSNQITTGLDTKVDKSSISDAIDSSSTTDVASSLAVKTAYDNSIAHSNSLLVQFAATMNYGRTF